MLGDFGKELPEDTRLVDLFDPEIPGLSAPPDESSFDFVTSEVQAQLGHLSLQKQEDILTLLQGYEATVFETRTMPRDAPTMRIGYGYHRDSWVVSCFGTSLPSLAATTARVGKTDHGASEGWYHSAECDFVCISSPVCSEEGWQTAFVY